MTYVLLLCQAVIAVTFGMSAEAKLSAEAFREFRVSLPATLRVPGPAAGPLAGAVVAAEAVTVVLAVAGLWVNALAVAAFVLAAALLTGFTAAVAVMIRRGVTKPCRCFGANGRPPGPQHLVRNVALLAVAVGGGVLASAASAPLAQEVANHPALEIPASHIPLYVLVALNLVLSVAVLVRLRRQNELLRISIEGVTNPEPIMSVAGERVREFVAATTDGVQLGRADLVGETLVAFLSPTCPFCLDSLPAFVTRAEAMPGGRNRVLAVLVGSGEGVQRMMERLEPVAQVIVEPDQGPVARAFGVKGMPAFALISDITVVDSHFVLDRVPETAPA